MLSRMTTNDFNHCKIGDIVVIGATAHKKDIGKKMIVLAIRNFCIHARLIDPNDHFEHKVHKYTQPQDVDMSRERFWHFDMFITIEKYLAPPPQKKYLYSFMVDKPISHCSKYAEAACPFFHMTDPDDFGCGRCAHPKADDGIKMNNFVCCSENSNSMIISRPRWCPLKPRIID